MPILQAGEARVHVQEAGDGPPVLLLHASTSSGGQWRDLQAMLAGEFRTLAPDLLGYGKTSPWDPSRELSSEHELALLDAVVAHAGGGPIHLVGHSYGGLTALRLAASGRAPLASLTLVEPIAFWLLRLAGEAELYGEMRGVADAFVAAWRRGDVDGAPGAFQ
jgi:pimeloyl-ACP methyl ester carboxylesterase